MNGRMTVLSDEKFKTYPSVSENGLKRVVCVHNKTKRPRHTISLNNS